jgi:DNA-directed RNA polymerase subunit RPC12/RpoP
MNCNERFTTNILCRCAACEELMRVPVIFPSWEEPFEDTEHTCEHCGTKLLVTDPHEYNEDGTIKN